MADPSAQALLALARGGGHVGVADGISPRDIAWAGSPGWGAVYQPGSSLPRAFETYSAGQFGPLAPLQPFPIDIPEPPGGRPRPRRFVYPVGWNIMVGSPGTEGLMLATFQQMEDCAEQPSIPRVLVDKSRNDILNLIGDDLSENIIPTPSAEKAMQGNPAKRKDWETRKAEVLAFFTDPDPDGHTNAFSDWLMNLLEDNVVIDAVALHIQPTGKPKAGPVDSSLAGLEVLSGDTIKPLLTMHGGRPRPPQPAYQQIAWGVPRVDLMDLLADFKPDDSLDTLVAMNPVLNDLLEEGDQFGADQLLYCVQNRRPRTPYGYSPVAQSLLAAAILFARETWQFEFFRSGSIPQVFLDPGESVATAEEARQLQEAINMLGGDLGAKHEVIVLPPGSKTMPQRDADLSSQFDEWMVAWMCMHFGYSISDVGLTPKVAALMSPQASRSSAQAAGDRAIKSNVIPRSKALKDQIFDPILQRHLGQKDMMWSWGIEEGGESLKDQIDQQVELVKASIITIDEARIELGKEPLNLDETSVPVFFGQQGLVPLGSPAQEALAAGEPTPVQQAQIEAKQPPALPPGAPGAPPGKQPPPKPGGPKTPPSKPSGSNGNGSKPNGNGGKPGGSSGSQTQGAAPASPAHAGARAAEAADKPSVPSSSKSAPMEAIEVEARQLKRHLDKGRPLVGETEAGYGFVGRSIPEPALWAARDLTDPEAIVKTVIKAAKRIVRRDQTVTPLKAGVGSSIAALGHQVQNGTLPAAAFAPAAAGVLSGAYSQAFTAGSADASDDFDGADAEDDWDDESTGRAQSQTPYLNGFALAIAAGITADEMDSRADSYGDTVTGAYEQGYGTTAEDAYAQPLITWHLGDADHCELCLDRDGEQYTPDDLPGWPGDGDYGEQCMGGPACACWLEYGDGEAESDSPTVARQQWLGGDQLDDVTGDGGNGGGNGNGADKHFDPSSAATAVARVYDSSTGTYVEVPRMGGGWPAGSMGGGVGFMPPPHAANDPHVYDPMPDPSITALQTQRIDSIHAAGKAGNPQALIDWYEAGADGAIDWGSPGDFDACVAIAGKYIDDPEGFCQLRHMGATGAPAGHAPGEDVDKSATLTPQSMRVGMRVHAVYAQPDVADGTIREMIGAKARVDWDNGTSGLHRPKTLYQVDKDFDESHHPRDEHGRFTSGGGGDSPSGRPTSGTGGVKPSEMLDKPVTMRQLLAVQSQIARQVPVNPQQIANRVNHLSNRLSEEDNVGARFTLVSHLGLIVAGGAIALAVGLVGMPLLLGTMMTALPLVATEGIDFAYHRGLYGRD